MSRFQKVFFVILISLFHFFSSSAQKEKNKVDDKEDVDSIKTVVYSWSIDKSYHTYPITVDTTFDFLEKTYPFYQNDFSLFHISYSDKSN